MKTLDCNNQLADALEKVLCGHVELGVVLEQPLRFHPAIESCFHGLHHFLADQDIRSKDPAYRKMQETEMRRLIVLLRSGAAPEEIRRITFLGSSSGLSSNV